MLLVSLVVTTLAVIYEGFRITHRIGQFLMSWFFLFITLLVVMVRSLHPACSTAVTAAAHLTPPFHSSLCRL